jgi:hypothetical protein
MYKKESSDIEINPFPQFVSFLDLVQWRLTRAGFNVVRA